MGQAMLSKFDVVLACLFDVWLSQQTWLSSRNATAQYTASSLQYAIYSSFSIK
jgi:hypothetical protein